MRQLEECFGNHYAFRDIKSEDSIFRSILQSPNLKHPDIHSEADEVYIPYLLLVGILYCASNVQLKV